MRTNIEIDDQFVSRAMRISGARTKKAAVEAGLQLETTGLSADAKLRRNSHGLPEPVFSDLHASAGDQHGVYLSALVVDTASGYSTDFPVGPPQR